MGDVILSTTWEKRVFQKMRAPQKPVMKGSMECSVDKCRGEAWNKMRLEVYGGPTVQNLADHLQDLGFYFKSRKKSLKGFKQDLFRMIL